MLKKIFNCQEYLLNEPILPQDEKKKHLYILECLSSVSVKHPKGQVMMKPFDLLVGQTFIDFQLSSQDRTPLLLRLYSISFDLPTPLSQYTVGDNPLIHDLMNEENASQAYIFFTELDAKLCHAYLDALACLEDLSEKAKETDYVAFQSQKVAGLLFTELLRDHEHKVSKSASQFPSAQVKYASKETQSGMIMKYVTENIQSVSLKEAAAYFAYQPNYFSRLCQNLFGLSFKELKTHIKLELAKEQLQLTTKSLEEISQELGYKAVSNFHRNFKSYTGLTPKAYRQESRLPRFED
ncbi:helix-turn-helix domain-containing protein [Streptococcus dentiloxodontae]